MNEQALRGYLNLARKAGRLALGFRAVRQSLAQGRCELLVLALDAGDSLQRLDRGDLPVIRPADKTILGGWFGRGELSVIGVTDPHLAEALMKASRASGNDPASGR